MLPRQMTNLDTPDALPWGQTHPSGAPCPFANDKLPFGFINTCCSFNTETAAQNLITMGHRALAGLLNEDLDAEKLPYVAKELRRAADEFEARYVKPMDTWDDPTAGGINDQMKERFNPCLRPAFEEAVTSIRQAADWYEKVGRLGFGVHAWY